MLERVQWSPHGCLPVAGHLAGVLMNGSDVDTDTGSSPGQAAFPPTLPLAPVSV